MKHQQTTLQILVYATVLASGYVMAMADVPPTTPVPHAYDRRCRSDIQAYYEARFQNGDPPNAAIKARMLQRAEDHPGDGEVDYWAANAAFRTPGKEAEGRALLNRAVEEHSPYARCSLGLLMCTGLYGVPKDSEKGLQLLKTSQTEDPYADYLMGAAYAGGVWGLHRNVGKAEQLLKSALAKGVLVSTRALAQLEASQGNSQKAEEYYELGARQLDLDSIDYLIDPSHRTAASRDPAKLRDLLILGLIKRDAQCARMYAANDLLGRFAEIDENLDRVLLVQSSNTDVRACALLAWARLQGLWGIEPQPERGLRELRWLAVGVDKTGTAAFLLGTALCNADNIPADREGGVNWLRRSAELGFPPAVKWKASNSLPAAANAQKSAETQKSNQPSAPGDARLRQLKTATEQEVLEECAARVDPREEEYGLGTLMAPADQAAEDDDVCRDWGYFETDPPSDDVKKRILARAQGPSVDITARTYAAVIPGIATVSRQDALNWLRASAEAGDPIATVYYGSFLVRSKGSAQEGELGLGLLEQAERAENPLADYMLGRIYGAGANGIPKDEEKEVSYLRKAAGQGIAWAEGSLGFHYVQTGNWLALEPLVKQGTDRLSEDLLATMGWIANGDLTVGDHSAKEPWKDKKVWDHVFWRGVMVGNKEIMALVGAHLADSDPWSARFMLERAAGSDCKEAQVVLDRALVTGELHIAADADRGIAGLEELAALPPSQDSDFLISTDINIGRIDAQWELGRLLYEGKYVVHDHERGLALIRQAAAANNVDAKHWLNDTGFDRK